MEIIKTIRNTEEIGHLLYQTVGGDYNVPKHIELLSVWVRDDFKNKGYGTKMVQSLIGIAKEEKISSIFVFVSKKNPEFQEFMKKNGFIVDGQKELWHISWS